MRVQKWSVIGLFGVGAALIVMIVSAGPQQPVDAINADFNTGDSRGWELIDNAVIRSGALELDGPGHGFWHAVHGSRLHVEFRVRQGEGVGEVVLAASGEPPNHQLYALRLYGPEIELLRISGGDERGMDAAPIGMESGSWHRFSVDLADGRIRVSVNGRPVLDAVDREPLPPGGVAFGCLAGGGFAFDDLQARRIDEAPQEGLIAEEHRVMHDPDAVWQTKERIEHAEHGEPAHAAAELGGAEAAVEADPMHRAEPMVHGGMGQDDMMPIAELAMVSVPVGPEAPVVAVADRIPERSLDTLQRAYVWKRLGGPLGGLGYDVRMRPGNPDVMYVSDAWAGVFKSIKGGTLWFPANQDIKNRRGQSRDAIPIFCLTVDPKRPDTVWVGAQNELGVYRSDDGGASWRRKENGIYEKQGITVRGFAVHPTKPDTVFMGAEIHSWAWNLRLNKSNKPLEGKNFDRTMGVVYKTTDGGAKWKLVRYFDNLVRYIFFDPNNPKTMYLSTGIFDREARNTDAAKNMPGGTGVFKSVDGGATWSPANNGLGNLYVGTLHMHPTDPRTLLAGTGCNPWQQGAGIYLTTDGAAHWKLVQPGDVITSVEFAEGNPKIAYAGSSSRIYRSTDGGRSWTTMTPGKHSWGPPGIRAGWPIDFQTDPRNPNRLFANNYGGGNFLSTDGGATWIDASQGYTGALVRDVAAGPGGTVWAAARSGVFRSGDSGATWTGMNFDPAVELDWPVVEIDPDDQHHVIAGSLWNAPLYERRGLRAQWRLAHRLKPKPWRRVVWTAVEFAPSNREIVWAGTGGVAPFGQLKIDLLGMGIYRSINGGASWSPANDSLSSTAHVQDLLIHPNNPDRVWAATSTHGVLFTEDGGGSWVVGHQGLPENAHALAIAGRPPWRGELFVGLDRAGVYRSTDWGESWQPFMAGMNPNAMVSDIVVDPTDTRVIYASDRTSGVYVWEPGANRWRRINHRLDNREVAALEITTDGRYLYAATEGSGVYRVGIPP